MTDEERTPSYRPDEPQAERDATISELTPQPVMELGDAPAAHYAEPAQPKDSRHRTADEKTGGTAYAEPAHFADAGTEEITGAFELEGAAAEEAPSPAAAHFAEPSEDPLSADPTSSSPTETEAADPGDYLGEQDTGELPPIDAIEAAMAAAHSIAPEDTAEIDVAAVEAKLKDPGTTQSFTPLPENRIVTDSTYDAGTTMSLMWGARSDVGCVRSHNEDSYLVASPLFAVCDGMGGHAAGEVASSLAVETIAKLSPGEADAARLAAAVEAANTAIIEAAAKGIGRPGMGCTATVAYIEGNTMAIAHVGDSRAYLMHEGVLTRITHDHSYVEELVDAGEITADEARVHPNRSVITRALGSDPAMYADHFQLNIEQGDRLILCSDGLSSMIPDSEIENIAAKSSTAQMCTDNLVDAALAAGGADNVSVVVVDVVDDGRLKKVIRTHRRNLFIAIGMLVCAIAAAAAIAFYFISSAVYLGADGDNVALYRGVPGSILGIELHRVEEGTSIRLSDLPEDTQSRLRAGIPQESLDEAWDTLSDYRRQIEEQQTKQAQNAEAIRESAEAAEAQPDPTEEEQKDTAPQAEGTPSEADINAAEADPATPTQEGGA